MIWFVIAAVVAAAGIGATVHYWNRLALTVTSWLESHGLNKGVLHQAIVQFDKVAVGLRRRIVVTTAVRGTEVIDNRYVDIDEIDDPQVRAQLQQHGQLNVDIMQQF